MQERATITGTNDEFQLEEGTEANFSIISI